MPLFAIQQAHEKIEVAVGALHDLGLGGAVLGLGQIGLAHHRLVTLDPVAAVAGRGRHQVNAFFPLAGIEAIAGVQHHQLALVLDDAGAEHCVAVVAPGCALEDGLVAHAVEFDAVARYRQAEKCRKGFEEPAPVSVAREVQQVLTAELHCERCFVRIVPLAGAGFDHPAGQRAAHRHVAPVDAIARRGLTNGRPFAARVVARIEHAISRPVVHHARVSDQRGRSGVHRLHALAPARPAGHVDAGHGRGARRARCAPVASHCVRWLAHGRHPLQPKAVLAFAREQAADVQNHQGRDLGRIDLGAARAAVVRALEVGQLEPQRVQRAVARQVETGFEFVTV